MNNDNDDNNESNSGNDYGGYDDDDDDDDDSGKLTLMFLAESLAGTTSAVDLELIKEKKRMFLKLLSNLVNT